MQISGPGKADHLAKLLLGVPATETNGAQQAAAHTAAGKDMARILTRSEERQRIQSLASKPDDARAERIARIRRSIESGTYDVSGRTVGDAILRQVLTDAVL